jgi:hypothetical protein
MGGKNEKAKRFRIITLQNFSDGEKIAKRFAHFFRVDVYKTVMKPITDKTAAIGSL